MFISASVMRRSRRVKDEKETVSGKEDMGNKAVRTPTNSLEVFVLNSLQLFPLEENVKF